MIAAAALLSDDGYPSLCLAMYPESKTAPGHGVFLYSNNGRYGSVGIARKEDYRPAVFGSPEVIMYDTVARFGDPPDKGYKKFEVLDLTKFLERDWIHGQEPQDIAKAGTEVSE